MDKTQAQNVLQDAGYEVHSIELSQSDVGHVKYLVSLSGRQFDQPHTFNASFQSGLEQKWGAKTVESLFGGEISMQREAAIYQFAREELGLPAPVVRLEQGEKPFLLEEVLKGKTLQEYVAALPEEQRESAYLNAVLKVGALFAKAHGYKNLTAYGDMFGNDNRDRALYQDRLHDIVTHNLAWNGHEKTFSHEELEKVRDYLQKSLQALERVGDTLPEPILVLANLHRGNVNLDENVGIVGVSQFNFAQAGVPAAEMYNAFWQFANPAFAPTAKVHVTLLGGYHLTGGNFDPTDEATQQVMNILNVNHFLRAATIYSTMRDRQDPSKPDLMRNRWGKRFKEEILFPLIDEGKVDYDSFSRIINEKWK